MRKEELIASLIQEAHNEVSKHNCRFSVDAEAQLRELITAGVERMTVEERYNGSKIAEAQRNMRYLCEKLCERTRRENRLFVENRTFSSARLGICPLWPFC
ncbi:MAG: hypothetical protein PUB84_07435 [Bacteroidales bacterium]|nr:hypothetical protein [Bacteroidales bacterium]